MKMCDLKPSDLTALWDKINEDWADQYESKSYPDWPKQRIWLRHKVSQYFDFDGRAVWKEHDSIDEKWQKIENNPDQFSIVI